MKKIFPLLIAILLFASPALAARWTFMVYLDGDNNLERAGVGDVNEMERVGSSSDVNIVVLFDRAKGHDSSNGDWNTAKVALIKKDQDTTRMSSFGSTSTDWGELNMGSRATLTRFVKYAMEKYPADKYALVLWNHGGGWRELELMDRAARGLHVSEPGFVYNHERHVQLKLQMDRLMTIKGGRTICTDDSHGSELHTRDVRLALEAIPRKIDLIGMDACLMGMVEVAYEIKDRANVMVASEESEPGSGWPYHTILQLLVRNPSIDEVALAKMIVDKYGEHSNSHPSSKQPQTLSAIRLSEMRNVANAVNRFISSLPKKTRAGRDINFMQIRNQSPAFRKGRYVDYRNFLSRIPASGNIQVRPLDAAVEKAVIWNYSLKKNKATGLSIFFPPRPIGDYHEYKAKNIQFAKDSLWDDFLAYVLQDQPIQGGVQIPPPAVGQKPSLIVSKLIAVKRRDSDEPAHSINPGETVYLKAYYKTARIPAKHKELILWGMFDPKGTYMMHFERLQVENSRDGSWVLINQIKIPGNAAKGKYYAFCDIVIYSSAAEKKANTKKIGPLPIGVDKSFRAAAPKIERNIYDSRKKKLLNQGKLLIVDAPPSALDLRIAVNKPGQFPEYKVNERFKIGIKTSQDAYFTMFTRQTDGRLHIIYPNSRNPHPKVAANRITFFPPKGKGSIRIGPPAGTENIKVIASITPITMASLTQYFSSGALPFGGQWNEASLSIRIKDRSGPLLDKKNEGRDLVYSTTQQSTLTLKDIYALRATNPFPLNIAFNVPGTVPVFHSGQKGLKIGVKPGANCYVALLHRNSTGQYSLLIPGQNMNNYATMNRIYYFPPPNQGFLTVAPPYGLSEVKAIATQDALNWNDLQAVYQYLTSQPGRWSSAVKSYEVK